MARKLKEKEEEMIRETKGIPESDAEILLTTEEVVPNVKVDDRIIASKDDLGITKNYCNVLGLVTACKAPSGWRVKMKGSLVKVKEEDYVLIRHGGHLDTVDKKYFEEHYFEVGDVNGLNSVVSGTIERQNKLLSSIRELVGARTNDEAIDTIKTLVLTRSKVGGNIFHEVGGIVNSHETTGL